MAAPVKQDRNKETAYTVQNYTKDTVPNYTKDKIMIVLYTLAIIIQVACYSWDEISGFIAYLCN